MGVVGQGTSQRSETKDWTGLCHPWPVSSGHGLPAACPSQAPSLLSHRRSHRTTLSILSLLCHLLGAHRSRQRSLSSSHRVTGPSLAGLVLERGCPGETGRTPPPSPSIHGERGFYCTPLSLSAGGIFPSRKGGQVPARLQTRSSFCSPPRDSWRGEGLLHRFVCLTAHVRDPAFGKMAPSLGTLKKGKPPHRHRFGERCEYNVKKARPGEGKEERRKRTERGREERTVKVDNKGEQVPRKPRSTVSS